MGSEDHDTESGTPQGGIISPLLCKHISILEMEKFQVNIKRQYTLIAGKRIEGNQIWFKLVTLMTSSSLQKIVRIGSH